MNQKYASKIKRIMEDNLLEVEKIQGQKEMMIVDEYFVVEGKDESGS